MLTSRGFIDDPRHRRLLEGQRYVVLRARGPVRAAYFELQRLVQQRLAGLDVSYPTEPHVTLLGVAAGSELGAVQGLVSEWARSVPPLDLEVERINAFPSPFQVLVLQIRRTPDLFEAMSRLRDLPRQRGLVDAARIAAQDWVFHLSVAYCASLNAASWREASQAFHELTVPAARAVALEAEIAAFDDGRESSGGVVPLTGPARQT